MPVEFVPPPAGQVRRNLFLKSVRGDEPPFSRLRRRAWRRPSAGCDSPAASARGRLPDGLADDVLATYNDGSACLVCTASDAGTLAVLNADLAASNLPGSPAFVPWSRNWSSGCCTATARPARPAAASGWWPSCPPR